ncbi:hypothetical protein NY2A_b834R [Paramecium bursaria Chlorella virus NY2A]|uniref:Uncharacterized protein b834R n=1 Tax=Paramecium bursaria Chlorella virus NY2A TaxID=46021 RepID=A7IY09_PBCVN|nr:hypothetical protein NY2A_b834R [Paramecium bursaria Chlorella virus NY2A]YP_001498831.1 hypothetical protein AR158_c750R [Paramecium bursaria Chlorella virus AR158]ABT15233.1 hypothetical protein NY2A_b834R [Paramecium bursaria Chlorella virus NY2A]ABU44295.1 hypothetical protein AR158_c750R [Paramecium bursaria Chlorella virus AR158]
MLFHVVNSHTQVPLFSTLVSKRRNLQAVFSLRSKTHSVIFTKFSAIVLSCPSMVEVLGSTYPKFADAARGSMEPMENRMVSCLC